MSLNIHARDFVPGKRSHQINNRSEKKALSKEQLIATIDTLCKMGAGDKIQVQGMTYFVRHNVTPARPRRNWDDKSSTLLLSAKPPYDRDDARLYINDTTVSFRDLNDRNMGQIVLNPNVIHIDSSPLWNPQEMRTYSMKGFLEKISQLETEGCSIRSIAKELDIEPSMLHRWLNLHTNRTVTYSYKHGQ